MAEEPTSQDSAPVSPTPEPEARPEGGRFPVLLGLVLLASAVLRLWNVGDWPRWYSDELFNLKVVQDLMDGELRVRAVSWTCFSPFHPYPIGYHLVGSLFCAVLGDSLWALRAMCGVLGIGVTLLVFLTARTVLDERAGLIAAAAYAIHPKVVLFTRMAFPQNLSPLVAMAALYAGLRYRQSVRARRADETGRDATESGEPTDAETSSGSEPLGEERAGWNSAQWLPAFALLVGCAVVSIYWAGVLLLFLAVVVLLQQPRKIFLAVGLALVPVALQFLAAAIAHGPGAAIYDLTHLFGSRIAESDLPGGGLLGTLARIGKGYFSLFVLDLILLVGVLGLVCLPDRWQAKALLTALVLLSLAPIAQRGALIADFFYTAVMFAPIPFVGFGVLFSRISRGQEEARGAGPRALRQAATVVLALAVIGIGTYFWFQQFVSLKQLPGEWRTKLDAAGFTVEDRQDALAAAAFVNANTSSDDFVIATPNLPALLHCRCTGVHQMASRLPGGTIWYPRDLPDHRYLYDLSVESAKFFVLDRLTLSFYITVRNCDEVLYRIHSGRWEAVAKFGEFVIFQNPESVMGGSEPGPPFQLSPALQLVLAKLHDTRGQAESAVRWYLRFVEEGGEPARQEVERALRSDPSLGAARLALERLQRQEASPP